ncbi:MAG: MGMT family protein [Actinobacteria bacterium]|nr:MGMT family protein [Actinomycetota bacterium]HRY08553.1 MGMT family protein [Candidatus Nanopelagicales bacterium]
MNPSVRDECVLEVVAQIPAGNLLSYGDVASLVADCGVACTARQVARCLSHFGSRVPWWRVVQSSGTIAEQVLVPARGHLAAEGIMTDGRRVDLDERRWFPDPEEVRAVLVRSGVL